MPKNSNPSPYASSFRSAINRGTPCSVAVQNIANRNNTPINTVWQSLYKAGHVHRQKFNGQWIYWAVSCKKSPATQIKHSQFNCWQGFIDWCIAGGFCTPEQLENHTGSQHEFMTYCRKFFAGQFSSNGAKSTGRKTTARKRTARKISKPVARRSSIKKSTRAKTSKPKTSIKRRPATKRAKTTSYKFPTAGARRVRKAA